MPGSFHLSIFVLTKNEKINCTVFAWKWQLTLVTSSTKLTKNERWNEPGNYTNFTLILSRFLRNSLYALDLCRVHFIFCFMFFASFGNKVTKISCHFQAKTVQLIFSFFIKTKNEMNPAYRTATLHSDSDCQTRSGNLNHCDLKKMLFLKGRSQS